MLTIRRSRVCVALLLIASGLAACGSAMSSDTTGSTPSVIATEAVTVTAVGQQAADGTAIPAQQVAPATSPGAYAGIPQSRTAEGYYVLGDPEAPIVMTHYSDFI